MIINPVQVPDGITSGLTLVKLALEDRTFLSKLENLLNQIVVLSENVNKRIKELGPLEAIEERRLEAEKAMANAEAAAKQLVADTEKVVKEKLEQANTKLYDMQVEARRAMQEAHAFLAQAENDRQDAARFRAEAAKAHKEAEDLVAKRDAEYKRASEEREATVKIKDEYIDLRNKALAMLGKVN